MRTCKNCGAPLDSDALFCTSCGTKNEPEAPQGRHCPHCGQPMDDDALFCVACGQQVESPSRPLVQDQPAPTQDTNATQGQCANMPNDVDMETEDTDGIRSWHYALGIAVVVIVLAAIIVPRLQKKTERVPLLTTMPQSWYRFVKSPKGSLQLYSEPNVRSKAGTVYEGAILPILDETDSFFMVYNDGQEYYVRKKSCKQLVNTDIDHDVMMNQFCTGDDNTLTVSEGVWKGLYITCGSTDNGDELVSMYIMHNGHLVQPLNGILPVRSKEGRGFDIIYSDDGSPLYAEYGTDFQRKNSDGDWTGFDVLALGDRQIVQLWRAMQGGQPVQVSVSYYFEDAGISLYNLDLTKYGDSVVRTGTEAVEKPTAVSAYSVLDKGDHCLSLMADMNGELTDTELDYSGNMGVGVESTGDFDGDGNLDCIVHWFTGGNCDECEGNDLVFFSEDDGMFHKIESVPSTDVEQWNGKTTLVYHRGISLVRYALEDGKLKEVESKTADVGKAVWTSNRVDMFPETDATSGLSLRWFDIDGDGEEDKIWFSHGNSHAYSYGQTMNVNRIECSGGTMLGDEYFGLCSGECFQILDHATNGMRDFLIDQNLYRWNGSKYDRWIFDGKELRAFQN